MSVRSKAGRDAPVALPISGRDVSRDQSRFAIKLRPHASGSSSSPVSEDCSPTDELAVARGEGCLSMSAETSDFFRNQFDGQPGGASLLNPRAPKHPARLPRPQPFLHSVVRFV